MRQEKFELPRLPALNELEARAEEALSNESAKIAPGIIEIICPVLERSILRKIRFMSKRGYPQVPFRNANIHMTGGDKVVCERHSVYIDRRTKERYSHCGVTGQGCPYSKLPGVEEKPK